MRSCRSSIHPPDGPSHPPATIDVVEYQALYRKYRPQTFDQVVGQRHVTETLAREISEGRVAHAYLFAGPRGTGKTTTARLLAKALNCPNRSPEGEPCDNCDSCQGVAASSSMDVVELDAASHNKVEDIRDIRISVSTVASVGGAKRIFILDEAHMLTKAASNALLKTLEEPPDHVHFVLATTEPYKLLDTIRSRSQRFDFHLITADDLVGHLQAVSEAEGYTATPGALLSVARHAAGSARDALSLLEQVAALGGGEVSEEGVQRALGLAGRDTFLTLTQAIADSDAKTGLELIADLAGRGVDLRKFLGDAISFFRGAFLARYSPNVDELTDEPADVIADWRDAAGRLQPAATLRAVDLLSEALIRVREGREERLMLELGVLKLTRPELADDAASVLARVEKLEKGGVAPAAVAAAPEPAPVFEVPEQVNTEDHPVQPVADVVPLEPKAEPEQADHPAAAGPPPVEEVSAPVGGLTAAPTLADLERIWPQLVAGVRNELGARREALFREAMPGGVEGSTLVLTVPESMGFHLEQLIADEKLASFVTTRATELLGHPVLVGFRSSDGTTAAPVEETAAEEDPAEDKIPDKDTLLEAPAEGTDPLSLLEDAFGAVEVTDD